MLHRLYTPLKRLLADDSIIANTNTTPTIPKIRANILKEIDSKLYFNRSKNVYNISGSQSR
ncbi:MAG TPA: hypothetical protein VJ697_04970 [Nitrososphaeraceae archaeon]|nr:hypothetical protein [Nitrososphaeraceae archaeon]